MRPSGWISLDVGARGLPPARRFFPERVQHIDNVPKAHRVDRAVGVAIEIVDHLEHARPLALSRLGLRVLANA
jgi:hypothetical protein